MGSSHGLSRITRLAYFEAPEYVVLLKRSFQLWHQLEQESGQVQRAAMAVVNTVTAAISVA